jgi:hypothetical protein
LTPPLRRYPIGLFEKGGFLSCNALKFVRNLFNIIKISTSNCFQRPNDVPLDSDVLCHERGDGTG